MRHIVSGRCAVCDCTDRYGCASGCCWVDAAHTLCSRCAGLIIQLAARLITTRT